MTVSHKVFPTMRLAFFINMKLLNFPTTSKSLDEADKRGKE